MLCDDAAEDAAEEPDALTSSVLERGPPSGPAKFAGARTNASRTIHENKLARILCILGILLLLKSMFIYLVWKAGFAGPECRALMGDDDAFGDRG